VFLKKRRRRRKKMKSALELAMEKSEKLGGAKKLTDKQKEEIAEIRRVGEAKIAELTIMADGKLDKLLGATEGDELVLVRDEVTNELIREKAKAADKTERAVEKVRNAK
jgi:DNA repair protein RadC